MHLHTSKSHDPYVPRDQNLRFITSVSTKGRGIQPSKHLKNKLPATYTTVPQLCDDAGGMLVRSIVPATSDQQPRQPFCGCRGAEPRVARALRVSFFSLLAVYVYVCARLRCVGREEGKQASKRRAAPCAVRAARTSVRRPVPPVHPTLASSAACRVLGSLTASRLVAPVRLRCTKGA